MRLRLGIPMVAILVASYAGPAGAAGFDYFTVTPCRLLDTRVTGFPLASGESRTFYVGGDCGVLLWSRELAFTVTSLPVPAGSVRLFLYPAGAPHPSVPIPMGLNLIPLAADGSTGITAHNDSTVPIQLVLDLSGYFLRSDCIEPPSGMAGWWPFDETPGMVALSTVAFDLAGGHHGVYLNSPAPVAGKVETARFFGPGQSVEVADAAGLDFGTGNFSFDAWLMTSRTGSAVDVILDKRAPLAGSIFGYHVFVYQGRLCLQLSDGGDTNYCSAAFVADGTWHHVAITVQRGALDGIHWYDNGTEVLPRSNPTAHSGSLDNSSPLSIGVRSPALLGGGSFQGSLDEIELFPRVLSAAEIQAIWHADDGGKCH